VVTIEGIGDSAHPDPLQLAFIDEQAAQRIGMCGVSDAKIREALAGNLCRCGAYQRIVEAIQTAAKEL